MRKLLVIVLFAAGLAMLAAGCGVLGGRTKTADGVPTAARAAETPGAQKDVARTPVLVELFTSEGCSSGAARTRGASSATSAWRGA